MNMEKVTVAIYIGTGDWVYESETIRYEMEGNDLIENELLSASPIKDGEEMMINAGYNSLSEWVYYSGDVVIPDHLMYKGQAVPVTSIGYLSACVELESLSIPSTVNELHPGIENCLKLKKIEVAEGNPSYKSVDGVLFSKDGKELLAYPALRPDDSYTIPKEVETIPDGVFRGCENLKEILVEEGNPNYKSVDGVLFAKGLDGGDCLFAYPIGNKATRFVIPETVTEIKSDAFYRSILEDVVCKSVEYIGSDVFKNCNQLRRLEGGSATKSIHLYTEHTVEIAGIEEMNNLESLSVDVYGDENGQITDLGNIGQLKNLKFLSIEGVKISSGLEWLEELQNLESFSSWSANVNVKDLYLLQKLPYLNSVSVGEVEDLSDLSWLEGMQSLSTLSLNVESIEVKDFTILLKMPNLRNVTIRTHTHYNGLKEMFEEMQEENTEKFFSYFEFEE